MVTFTEKLSGYLAAAAALTWPSGQTIDSLTDNEWTDLTDELDNSTNKYVSVDLYIDLASAAFTGADAGIEAYLVPSVDGTNYPAWTGNATADAQENQIHRAGFAPIKAATAACKMVLRDIDLPPGKYKWGFRNRGNVTTAASGNTISWRPHSRIATDA